jgi:hypothetical protein
MQQQMFGMEPAGSRVWAGFLPVLQQLGSAELMEVRARLEHLLDTRRAQESAAMVQHVLSEERSRAVAWAAPPPQAVVVPPHHKPKKLPSLAKPDAAPAERSAAPAGSVRVCNNPSCLCFYVFHDDEERPPRTLDLKKLFVIGCNSRNDYRDERQVIIDAMGKACPALKVIVQPGRRFATLEFASHRLAALAQTRLSRVASDEEAERYPFRYTVSFLDEARRHPRRRAEEEEDEEEEQRDDDEERQ